MATERTVLDALADALRDAARYNHDTETPPAAVLWPDPDGQWRPLARRVDLLLPVLTLGEYMPALQSGSAAWVRCTLAEMRARQSAPVVAIYLPGWRRQELRRVDGYRQDDRPLADIVYRAAVWYQPDGKEWTVAAFLQRKDAGLGIEVHNSAVTHQKLLESLDLLADQTVVRLRADAPLKAKDFELLGAREPVSEGISPRELIARGESAELEFKSTFRFDIQKQVPNDAMLAEGAIKSVAAFLNSREGGILLVGVDDAGQVLGLDNDLKLWPKEKRTLDQLEIWFWGQLFKYFGGKACAPFVRVTFPRIDGRHIALITVRHASEPTLVYKGNQEIFYLRTGNRTDALGLRDALAYIRDTWG